MKTTILHKIFVFRLILALLAGLLPVVPAQAYDSRCPNSTDSISVDIDGRQLTFSNLSASCRQIGVAVYRLTSATSRDDAFYYSRTFGLQPGRVTEFSVPVPSCAYAIAAFVGEPQLRNYSQASYGSLLIKEVVNTSAPYCPARASVTRPSPTPTPARWYPPHTPTPTPTPTPVIPFETNGDGTISYTWPDPQFSDVEDDEPLPSPRRNAPAPSPTPSAVPLPKPRVLGAKTELTAFDVKTGAGLGALALPALGAVAAAAVVLPLRRKRISIDK